MAMTMEGAKGIADRQTDTATHLILPSVHELCTPYISGLQLKATSDRVNQAEEVEGSSKSQLFGADVGRSTGPLELYRVLMFGGKETKSPLPQTRAILDSIHGSIDQRDMMRDNQHVCTSY